MKLKMESTSNGKTPKTSGTGQQQQQPQQQQQQQNGSTTGGGSSVRVQNGSKHRSTMKPGSSTMMMATTPSSTTSSSLPTPVASSSSSSSSWPQFRFATTLPLRILVLKDLVGAIIGRGGGTIRQITQDTHARVDVHRKENSTSNENVIMIYGNPDNCSQACRRILEVMQQEAKSLNRPDEIALKILASNNLIGRIIGKGGNTIKRIMQQTDTKIAISSANMASQYQMERVISISGQLENMCKAEVMISQKLRQCFESDYMQYQQSLMYTGFHSPIPPLLPAGQSGPLGHLSGYGPGPQPHTQHQPPPPMSAYPMATSSTCTNLPPSALMGRSPAVLAAAAAAAAAAATGSVSSPPSSGAGPSSQTHPVTPTTGQGPGGFYSPYNLAFMYPPHGPAVQANINAPFSSGPSSASYMNIGFLNPMLPNVDNIKETVTIFIPNSVVGAIIGRGGSTIREMMSNSGAIIKVAQMSEEDSAFSSSGDGANKLLERRVTIFGNSFSQNQAQFFVFQKVFQELSNQLPSQTGATSTICPYGDPSILKVEILVPTNQVRRIIGKGGSVITDLQRTSGATIKLSKDSTSSSSQPTTSTTTMSKSSSSTTTTAEQPQEPSSTPPSPPDSQQETTTTGGQPMQQSPTTTASGSDQDLTSVFIIGDFYASFNAQRQIRLIVHRSIPGSSSSSSVAATTATSLPSTITTSSQHSMAGKSTTIASSTSTTRSVGDDDDDDGDDVSVEESEKPSDEAKQQPSESTTTSSAATKITTTTTATTTTVGDSTTSTVTTSSNTASVSPAYTTTTTTTTTSATKATDSPTTTTLASSSSSSSNSSEAAS